MAIYDLPPRACGEVQEAAQAIYALTTSDEYTAEEKIAAIRMQIAAMEETLHRVSVTLAELS